MKRVYLLKRFSLSKALSIFFKENKDEASTKEKPWFWNKNKNTVNDGIVDENMVKPMVRFPRVRSSNNIVNIQGAPRPPRKYTPLGEPVKSTLKKLIANNLVTFSKIEKSNYDYIE